MPTQDTSTERPRGGSPPLTGSVNVAEAKGMIGDEVRQMLRLTRQLLRPSNHVNAAAAALDDVMKPLAEKIRAAENPEVMRAAIDEIILDELRARYGREQISACAQNPRTSPVDADPRKDSGECPQAELFSRNEKLTD